LTKGSDANERPDLVTRYPRLMELITLLRKRHPELISPVAPTDAE
jgi:hypothetical protein